MFAKQMTELAERRRLLVVEADLHRSLIGLERENLRARLTDLQTARERVAAGSPLLIAGGAVAGLLAVRHWRKLARWIPVALTVLRWVRRSKWSE
jgi:hypothetical protein